MGYAIRITTRAVEVVAGGDQSQDIVASASSGVKVGLRQKWGGGELRNRPGKMVRQGSGWVMEGTPGVGSPAYLTTPLSSAAGAFPTSPYPGSPYTGGTPPSPYVGNPMNSAGFPPSAPGTPNPASSTFGPNVRPPPSRGAPGTPRSSSLISRPLSINSAASLGSTPMSSAASFGAPPVPGTPGYGIFPPTPNPAAGNGSGFPTGPPPRRTSGGPKKDD